MLRTVFVMQQPMYCLENGIKYFFIVWFLKSITVQGIISTFGWKGDCQELEKDFPSRMNPRFGQNRDFASFHKGNGHLLPQKNITQSETVQAGRKKSLQSMDLRNRFWLIGLLLMITRL